MRIALLTNGVFPFVLGGMQKHSSQLAISLVKNGVKVDLFHFVLDNVKMPSEKEVNQMILPKKFNFSRVYCYKFTKSFYFPGHYIWNSYFYSKWVYNNIRNNIDEYDFIYAKGFSAWKLLNVNKKENLGLKIGVQFHGYEMYQKAPTFKLKLQHLMLRPFVASNNRKATFVFSYGGKISKIIQKLKIEKDKIIDIPTFIDEDWIRESELINSKCIKFLFIGRYERRKGIEELNDALQKLNKTKEKLDFHFVGNIPINKQLKLDNISLFYHGIVTEPKEKKDIFDSCDVLICPSYSEGMPNVILEAMARGLAIIATDVGAISEMVDSTNGILMANNKSPLIMSSIMEIISNKNKLNFQKKSSITKVKNKFSSNVVIEQLLDKF